MIEITYAHMNTTSLEKTMSRLFNDTSVPQKVAYSLMKYSKDIFPAYKKAKQIYTAMLGDYAEKTDTGEFMTSNGEAVIREEVREKYDLELEKLMQTTVKVLWTKLPIEALAQVSLSASDLSALEPFIDGLDRLA